jgi:hypothetical protein
MAINESDLQVGDKVTVTRVVEGETPTSWTGVVTYVGTEGGFSLRGETGGLPWGSAFSDADTLLRAYGCTQTIARAT